MWGSDLIAEAIRALGYDFAALNPGASYRGLHDSLVNHAPGRISLLTCLHDEHAVAFAHGWTKVTGKPALALLHSNVGLLHAAMAIHNAWVDRAPVVVVGASGAMNADARRPWIEWIHTMQDQAAVVRPYTKWDDQPASAPAAARSIAEGTFRARQMPCGPVYVCLDVTYQETMLQDPPSAASLVNVPQTERAAPAPACIESIVTRLRGASRPLMLFGRTSRSEDDWRGRVTLAERLGARVVTDIRSAAAFPTDHAAHIGAPGFGPDAVQQAAIDEADVILAFDPIDPATLTQGRAEKTVLFTLDQAAHRGFMKDSFGLPADLVLVPCEPDAAIASLVDAYNGQPGASLWTPADVSDDARPDAHSLTVKGTFERIAAALERGRERHSLCITRLPLSWPGDLLPLRHPLDYIGRDGGEGLASGPGIAAGAAYALAGTGRLPVAFLGDGDFAMGVSALWTAANQRLPLLVLVAANRVYGNDVVHQRRVAEARCRPLSSIWVGQCLDNPVLEIADMARSFGALEGVRCESDAPNLEGEILRLAERALTDKGVCVLEIVMPARDS